MNACNKESAIGGLRVLASAVIMLLMLFMASIMCGCKTQYVPKEKVRIEYREADTTAINSRLLKMLESRKQKELKSDSLVDRTKETVVLNEQGDTTKHFKIQYVYLHSIREVELENTVKILRDSISLLSTRFEQHKCDSVPVPYPVTKIVEVKKQPPWWQIGLMYLGGIFLVSGILVAMGFLLYKKIRRTRLN